MTKPTATSAVSRARRAFYYLTAGLTGSAIMVIEVLGARMLAPYLGTSHFVWTSQIAVTLAALATGYYAGGLVADRSDSPTALYGCIVLAGSYLAGSVLCAQAIAFDALQFGV